MACGPLRAGAAPRGGAALFAELARSVLGTVLTGIRRKPRTRTLLAGLSTQEYVRRLLTRDARLRSADEMVELQRTRRTTASDPDDLDTAVRRRAARRAVVC